MIAGDLMSKGRIARFADESDEFDQIDNAHCDGSEAWLDD